MGGARKAEQVLLIIKTFLAEILLIKSYMHSIIRSLTSVLISSRQLIQEAQLMLTTGSTRLAVSRGQQTWYHFGSIATFR